MDDDGAKCLHTSSNQLTGMWYEVLEKGTTHCSNACSSRGVPPTPSLKDAIVGNVSSLEVFPWLIGTLPITLEIRRHEMRKLERRSESLGAKPCVVLPARSEEN